MKCNVVEVFHVELKQNLWEVHRLREKCSI